jgi:hypothetical protein
MADALLLLDLTSSQTLACDNSREKQLHLFTKSWTLEEAGTEEGDSFELLQAAQILLEKQNETRGSIRQIGENKLSSVHQKTCSYCQTIHTPLWRHGPAGYEDLCNKVNTI